jgi:membrane-anchored protein YejM (alkaline phosphatase superfamily)
VSGDVPDGATGTRRRSTLVRGANVVCVAALAFAAVFARSPSLRQWHEAALRGASREPVYLGRLLRRMNGLEAMAQPSHRQPRARIEELAEAYDIAETTPDPLWDGATRRKASSSARPDRPSPPDARGYNVLVYYVDTLRSDVAFDGAIMPNVERFARDSLVFQRAYSPGSDTRRALPGLVTGRYGASWNHETSLLTQAKRLGLPTTLFIGESAFEFLSKLVPEFAFDDTLRFPDYAQGGVWGYGAHQPTAGRIVDHAIDWLSQRGPSPFFVWLFNFDVHAWRELDRDYVYSAADRYQVPDEGPYNWRYRVVARSVDAEFGRLMVALKDLGLADRTIVVFVSDHGEGLGYRDFWVHSTFLWEPLVHVPLLLRVPGVAPVRTERLVSLVDVAPTLARLLDPKAPQGDYHGEDLLSEGVVSSSKRRFPVLLSAASDEAKTRVGIVGDAYKLVLPTEWGEPELYDLRASDPDAKDVAQDHPGQLIKLLGPLLRSPVVVEP